MHQHQEPLVEPASALNASDKELLSEYAATRAEAAFASLVRRYVDLVYSAALRQTDNHAIAQDVTQSVFTILARKAASLRRETVLGGWLIRAVRYAALDARKMETRRQIREQEAAQMRLIDSIEAAEAPWEQFAPLLDEALTALGATDRNAILLRFFEKKSFGEIGNTLGGNENSARVRVVRAVEKLRRFFRRRGVVVSAAALTGALLDNAVQAAPPALATSLACPTAATALTASLLRRLLWRRIAQVGAVLLLLLLLSGGLMLAFRQRTVARSADLADAARSVRELMIAIDRTYTRNDPGGFVALIYFRSAEEQSFGPVLADYVRAEASFRQEMERVFKVRQRTFNATFRELCVRQPGQPATYIRSDSVATNIMMAKYPVLFVKDRAVWKWDLFEGLTPELRAQRIAILRHKITVLDKLTTQVRGGTATNLVDVLDTLGAATP